ncbi:uncharacterized protein LOC107479689 [Arachis duranensis]|uniref:Uncharacterized protein LOC107479689 n=1 Tax=Arachis duranensis TaxID=130453 RepID=A0A6P4CQY6_ARADU|nr:uncharacterized protein LOC107479689 [Arachis duranensis]
MGATPFHHSVLEVRLPKHFNKPTDMRYDGTQDPQEHLMAFEARMNLEGVGDEVRCRLSRSLWQDLQYAKFTTRIAKVKHPINLLGVTQRSGEPTRKYLDRFNDECLEIDGITDSVASLCLTNGLLNEDFRKDLTTKPVWTIQEIQSMVREYINDEEVSQVVGANKRQPAYNQPRQHEVYQQIPEKGILSKPQLLKDRIRGNKNLYCDYHKGYGHKTHDCFDLKDALEQAIRDRKLAEFFHLTREPRRRDRNREGEDKSHMVKRRQEPEDHEHERGSKVEVGAQEGRQSPGSLIIHPRAKLQEDSVHIFQSRGPMV